MSRPDRRSSGPVPSRAVLRRAEETRAETGLELGGFLSEAQGFLPSIPRPEAFPSSHAAWDEITAALPSLWRDVGVRKASGELPLLRGTAAALPDEHLWRASSVLGMLAHSYVRSEIDPPDTLPPTIQVPWEEVSTRLGREEPFLQFSDIILGNWRLQDPNGPIELPNLEIIAACLRVPAEIRFYGTMIELHVYGVDIARHIVRAQEAAVAHDNEMLAGELLGLIRSVRAVHKRFARIDPNPSSETYVDPVIWGALVAPFAVSLKPHIAGPGGTASPLFHALDAFLGRTVYTSAFGEEAMRLRRIAPPFHQKFVEAIAELPIRPFIEASGSRELNGLLRTLMEVYAGERGLIMAHRAKAYGYLQIAFKVGRPVTIGGFGGTFVERPWVTVDHALEETRLERKATEFVQPIRVTLKERGVTDPRTTDRVRHVVLDVADHGVVYRPGDRLGVLPENEPDRIERTLKALGADGGEPIGLTREWQTAIRNRRDYPEGAQDISLREFLRYAQLRPMSRAALKTLQRLTDSRALKDVVELRAEDQWELADVLEVLSASVYDVSRLVAAEPWQEESLAAIIPPAPFRLYSISSLPENGDERPATSAHLTVGMLECVSGSGGPEPRVRQRGMASVYVNETAPQDDDTIVTQIVRPLRFHMPDDPETPILMFAGGTGISPFRGFLEAVRNEASPREAWLVFGTRTQAELHYRGLLEEMVSSARLTLAVAFSREDTDAVVDDDGRLELVPGRRKRVGDVIAEEPVASALWRLMRSEADGGAGARVYVCGQAGFASGVIDALRTVAVERLGDADAGTRLVRELMAQERLMLDVFTTFAPAHGPDAPGERLVDASELVLHNDDEHGHWFAISGAVYDVSEFQHLHPGGKHIIHAASGIDATREWNAVLHDKSPPVEAMLSMYRIGSMRRLDLRDVWGIALMPDGLTYMSLEDAYRRWVRFLYLITEMESSYANDLMYLPIKTTALEVDDELTGLKLMLFGNTHARFVHLYYPTAFGAELDSLWSLTVGLAARKEDVGWIRAELTRRAESPAGRRVLEVLEDVRGLYRPVSDTAGRARARDIVTRLEQLDRRLLRDIKMRVREGIMLFEQHQQKTLDAAGRELVDVLRGLPAIVDAYHADVGAETAL